MSAIASAWVATLTVGNQTAKQLLQFYASHNFGKPGFEFKNSTLSIQLEVTERAIQLAHKLLIEKELIIKETRYNDEGRQLTNNFYLNIPQSFVDNFMGEGERSSPPRVNVVRGEGERSSPLYNNNLNNNYSNKSSIAQSVAQEQKIEPVTEEPDRFEDFWNIYPRKKDKKKAKRIWKNRKCEVYFDQIMNDIRARLQKDAQWADIQFIPHPSTYLNGERWTDEITPPAGTTRASVPPMAAKQEQEAYTPCSACQRPKRYCECGKTQEGFKRGLQACRELMKKTLAVN